MLLICLPESSLIAASGGTAFLNTVLQERSVAPPKCLIPADDRLFDIVLAIVLLAIALGPASFNSSYRCEVVSKVVDRGELTVWIVVDSLTNTILDSLDWDSHV